MMQLLAQQLTVDIAGLRVCERLDFTVAKGQRWGILGSNGIGKTTLLHTLAGLRLPVAGRILLDETNIHDMHSKQRARYLGLMFQDSHDIFPISVWQAAMNGRYAHQSFWSVNDHGEDDLVASVLEYLDLFTMKERAVDTLSGGERRRLAIATLMIQDPQVWFMDEPTNHLDLHHQINTLELMTQHISAADHSAVLVLHDVNLIIRFCTHALLMLDKEIISGEIDEVMNKDNIERLYHHPVSVFEHAGRAVYLPA